MDWASSALTKIRFSQTIGVPAPGPASGTDQARFLSLSSLSGRPVAVLEPFRNGPRHCGQELPAAELLQRRYERLRGYGAYEAA